jgi:putative transposase
MDVPEAKRLKQLENENARLKNWRTRCWMPPPYASFWQKMVGRAAQREGVAHLQAVMGLSERRACSIVNADRKMIRYRSCWTPNTELRLRLRDLSNERKRFRLSSAVRPPAPRR